MLLQFWAIWPNDWYSREGDIISWCYCNFPLFVLAQQVIDWLVPSRTTILRWNHTKVFTNLATKLQVFQKESITSARFKAMVTTKQTGDVTITVTTHSVIECEQDMSTVCREEDLKAP